MQEAREAIDSAPYPYARVAGLHQLVDDLQELISGR